MKIERIEVVVTDLEGRLQRQIASGPYDTGGRGGLTGKPVLVRLYAEGVVGLGQIRPIAPSHLLPDTVRSMVSAIVEYYGPRLIGTDLADVESAWQMFDRTLAFNANARAALDHAVVDALGKAYGVPAYALLGGLCQPRVPLEWSVSIADETATMVAEAVAAVERFGIRVLCVKAGHAGGWRRDVVNFRAVRAAVGADVAVGVDANMGWSVPDAKRAVLAMAEVGLDYIEQPIERRNVAGLAAIRTLAAGIPVMADESLLTLQDAHALALAGAVDVFCIKLYRVGGLHIAKKIAAVAESAGILLNVGGLAAFSQLEAAAGAHFYASTPTAQTMPAAEFVFGLGVIGRDPLVPEPAYTIDDGCVVVPALPGLGVTIDEAQLTRLTLMREAVA